MSLCDTLDVGARVAQWVKMLAYWSSGPEFEPRSRRNLNGKQGSIACSLS